MGGSRPAEIRLPLWANIPSELTARSQWVVWRWFRRGDGDDWTKPPYPPDNVGKPAKVNNPKDWSSFAAARARLEKKGANIHGVGYVLSDDDPFTAIDLDGCLDSNFQITDPVLAEYVSWFEDTYIEVSPSQTGLRIFCIGQPPSQGRQRKGKVEIYASRHYMTVTGQVWPPGAAAKPILSCQAEIDRLYQAAFGGADKHTGGEGQPRDSESTSNISEQELLTRARSARNGMGERFIALFDRGDWQSIGAPSKSEADLSLLGTLAFWTAKDAARMEALFSLSLLCDSKWEERADYRERSITKAIEGCSKTYQPRRSGKKNAAAAAQPEVQPEVKKAESEDELALVDRVLKHQPDLLYSKGIGYYLWDRKRFRRDQREQVEGLGEAEVRSLYADAARNYAAAAELRDRYKTLKRLPPKIEFQVNELETEAERFRKLATQLSRRSKIEGALAICRSHVAVDADELDAAPYLLNCANGTVDLREPGPPQPHSRADRITKLINLNYVPDASAVRWEKVLEEIFDSDRELCEYFRRAVGYSLTAEQKVKRFWFNWGPGDTGKTTVLSILSETFGEYAQVVPVSVFLKARETIPHDIAGLRGVRFAYASEVAKGRSFDPEKLKNLTGCEGKLTARFLHQPLFEFTPSHHLWLAANDKPKAEVTDDALWKRLAMIPFQVIFERPTEDKPNPAHRMNDNLIQELRKEKEGILAWAIRGAREFYTDGLNEPKAVRAATAKYRSAEDRVQQFVTEALLRGAELGVSAKKSDVWLAFKQFMEGERHMGKQHFNELLRNRYGFVEDGRDWANTAVRPEAMPPKSEKLVF
jgi:putative DNA primase/helicase